MVTTKTLHIWATNERRMWKVVIIVFLFLFCTTIWDSRLREHDNSHVTIGASLKQQLEQYYNEHSAFPIVNDAIPLACALSTSTGVTHLGDERVTSSTPTRVLIALDRMSWKRPLFYCPSGIQGEKHEQYSTGFYIEFPLQRFTPSIASFDYDEGRNYRYRIFQDTGVSWYRICGGTELSCNDEYAPLVHNRTLSNNINS